MTESPPRLTPAYRTCIFAVDASTAAIDQLLLDGWQSTALTDLAQHVEALINESLHEDDAPTARAVLMESPATFAASIALAANRAEHARPFADSDGSERKSENARRKTHIDVAQPLAQNPGGSLLLNRLRAAVQECLCAVFDEDADFRRRAVQVLLSATAAEPVFAQDHDHASHLMSEVAIVTGSDDRTYARCPSDAASEWVRLVPAVAAEESQPPIRCQNGAVFVPLSVVAAKLREYTRHSFDRLVHRGFHVFKDWRLAALADTTWGVEKLIHDVFVRNHTSALYGERRYDTGSSRLVGRHSTGFGFRPATHNHHLATIVDVIRASDALSFDAYHTAAQIFAHAREYYPPPHRPTNRLWSVQRVAQTLRSAADASGETNDTVDRREQHVDGDTRITYRIAEPRFSPFYTPPADAAAPHRWDAYRTMRATYGAQPLSRAARVPPRSRDTAGTTDDPLVKAKRRADQYIAAHPHTRALADIEPARRPCDLAAAQTIPEWVTWDDIQFLTRVVTGLNGVLADRTLLDGMADYTRGLDVDPAALAAADVITQHDEPYPTLYSVNPDIVSALGLAYATHDGYGEHTPRERGLHKYATTLDARGLAQRDDVAEAHRYVSLWRFDLEYDELAVAAGFDPEQVGTLRHRRVDVAAVDATGAPLAATEVQQDHGKAERVETNWETLRILGEAGVTATWLCPNIEQLQHVVRQLQRRDCLGGRADDLPVTDRVSVWEDYLVRHELTNPGVTALSTLRSRYREVNQ